jgi:tellurite resistance-related uncharacterized protein
MQVIIWTRLPIWWKQRALESNPRKNVAWEGNWEEIEVLEGPLAEIVSKDGKGEMASVVGVEGDALVEGSRECGLSTRPSPWKGNGIEL